MRKRKNNSKPNGLLNKRERD